MNQQQSHYQRFYFRLNLTVFFLFFIKSVDYLILGRILPFLLMIIFIYLYRWAIQQKSSTSIRILRIWGTMLLLGGLFRLFMAGTLHFSSVLNEAHLYEQFGLFGIIVTFYITWIGIYSLKNAKKEIRYLQLNA